MFCALKFEDIRLLTVAARLCVMLLRAGVFVGGGGGGATGLAAGFVAFVAGAGDDFALDGGGGAGGVRVGREGGVALGGGAFAICGWLTIFLTTAGRGGDRGRGAARWDERDGY